MPNENVSRSVRHQQEIGYETVLWRFAIIPPPPPPPSEILVTRGSVRYENCLYSIMTYGPKISNRTLNEEQHTRTSTCIFNLQMTKSLFNSSFVSRRIIGSTGRGVNILGFGQESCFGACVCGARSGSG